ncbi:hypothetical protein FA95DRAFT_1570553 [Auriscalpium vulgare]|uniref:Uncharacterized protein n=1 Tax=Auriscalpium vulgare TaxID=40419 RepID=A0ACB8S299_9AGAM|nr:hypothetical protein FA95DRAFT_1570553 [Auriscalpium vulgare]
MASSKYPPSAHPPSALSFLLHRSFPPPPNAPAPFPPPRRPMGLDLSDGLVQIKLTESVAGFIAICMTVTRIWIRRDRYWWDDAWAVFALLNLFVQFASVFMHVENPAELSKTNRVAAYYLMAATFYTIIWSARTSILFSIIRIDPDPQMRRRLKWLAALFIAALVFFLTQLLWVCEPMHAWKNLPSPQCHLTKEVAICQLVSDIIADILLITLPLRLIHGIKDKGLRRRLIFIFSTSIVTTIVSLVHAAYIITIGGKNVLISALVEDCMSLTVANVPVVGAALLRRVGSTAHGSHASAYADDAENGPRWSSFRFKTRSWVLSTVSRSRRPATTVERGPTQTTSTATATDLGAEPKGEGAHYISVGSLREADSAGSVSVHDKPRDGAHYISIGSVRHDDAGPPAPADVVRIGALPGVAPP